MLFKSGAKQLDLLIHLLQIKKAPSSIRGKFSVDGTLNAVHGADAPDSHERESKFWFGGEPEKSATGDEKWIEKTFRSYKASDVERMWVCGPPVMNETFDRTILDMKLRCSCHEIIN